MDSETRERFEKVEKEIAAISKRLDMVMLAVNAFNNHPQIENLTPSEVAMSSISRFMAALVESGKFQERLKSKINDGLPKNFMDIPFLKKKLEQEIKEEIHFSENDFYRDEED